MTDLKKLANNNKLNTNSLSLIESLKSEKCFSNVDINESNVFSYLEVFNSIKHCDSCQSLDSCKNNVKGFTKYYDLKSSTVKAKACKYKEILEKKEFDSRLFKTMFMPDNVLSYTLDTYNLDTPRRKTAYKCATRFITNPKEETGLFLSGTFGIGKTYLLACVANELSRRGISVILAYFPDLVREIKNNMTNGERLEEIINRLKTIDVLMLDDLGSENLSSWLRDEILGPILNYRYEAHKPVCISSNLSIEELSEHFSKTSDSIDTVKGARLMKRLQGVCGNYIEF